MKYTKFISILKAFKDSNISEPMVSLGNSHELPSLIRGIGWRIVYAAFPNGVKLTRRLKQLQIFIKYLLTMSKRHGPTTTVKYLKSSTLAIQKAIAGYPLDSLRELEPNLPLPRLQNGLPRFIPIEDRRAIRRGNTDVIRWWLTCYSIYRIIRIPGTLKLSTITNPTSASKLDIQMGSVKLAYLVSQFKDRFDFKILKKEVWLLPLEKASPHSPVSWTSWFKTPGIIARYHKDLFTHMNEYMSEFKSMARFSGYFFMIAKLTTRDVENLPMGKLSTKEEAAGKIRVFAMVDCWTQSMLKPLHDLIFSFLKTLPNDGTFDQQASVERAKIKAKSSGVSFGYDLSAATDRLPLALQISVLSSIIGEKAANLWAKILVDRDYILKYEDETHILRYATGQPMGALSSWGMLALTHHFIVQLAYRESYSLVKADWFDNYELLGDDIVLFDEKVAKQYLFIMEGLGVEINLSKSVLSNNGSFEFAKVSSFKGQNVSGVPWKMFISQRTRMGRVNILLYLIQSIQVKHPIRYIKNITMFRPGMLGDYGFTLIALLTMLTTRGVSDSKEGKFIFSWSELLRTLGSCTIASQNYIKNLLNSQNITYLEYLITTLIKKDYDNIQLSKKPLVDMSFAMDHPFQKIGLANYLLDEKSKVSQLTWKDSLVEQVINNFLPGLPESSRVLQYPSNSNITNDAVWLQRLFQSIYFTVDHFFKGFDELYKEIKPGIAHKSIEELIHMKEKWDSYKETHLLVDRALKKINGGSDSKLKRTESLKALQFIVKSSKGRPIWTYDIERMSHLRFMRISKNSFR